MEEGIVYKLKRLSIHSPPKMDHRSSLLLSDEEVNKIIAKTSSPTVLVPLPIITQVSRTEVLLVSSVSTCVSPCVTGDDQKRNQLRSFSDESDADDFSEGDGDSNELFSTTNLNTSSSSAQSTAEDSTSSVLLPSPVTSTAHLSSSTVIDSDQNTTPIHEQLSKSLPNLDDLAQNNTTKDDLDQISRELELLKKLVITNASKYDLIINDLRNDLLGKTKSVENLIVDDLRSSRTQIQDWVNTEHRSIETRVSDFVNDKLEQFIELKREIEAERQMPKHPVQQQSNTPPSSPSVSNPDIINLQKQLHALDVRLLECEQYSRRESIVISGIPNCVQQGELEDVAIQIFQELDISVQHDDISAIHRLGKPNRRYPTRVIIRFVNRKFVDLCLKRQDRLANLKRTLRMNLRFYESLASLNLESVRICEHLLEEQKISKYFLRNGYVKVVVNPNDNPFRINHPDVLREKFVVPESVT